MVGLRCWAPAVVFALVIFSVSAESTPPGADLAPDYVAHFFEYGLFALTLIWGVTSGLRKDLNVKRAGLAFMLAAAYALTDEFHQGFVPQRDSSLQDILADCLGAACAILIVYGLLRRWSRSRDLGA